MFLSVRGNKSIKAVYNSQVVRLDVFSAFFEVVWSGWMLRSEK